MSKKTNHSEIDPIGELFRQQLENHRLPVDSDGWSEIERRLGKKKNARAIWLWSGGAMAAAASLAFLLVMNIPNVSDPVIAEVSQHATTDDRQSDDHSLYVTDSQQEENAGQRNISGQYPRQDIKTVPVSSGRSNAGYPVGKATEDDIAELSGGETAVIPAQDQTKEPEVAVTEDAPDIPTGSDEPVIAQATDYAAKLDISLVEDRPEDEPVEKEKGKWLLAATFGTGGSVSGFEDDNAPMMSDSHSKEYFSFNNDYATSASGYILSTRDMTSDDFSRIDHQVPVSFGLMARKDLGKRLALESGLVYTSLSTKLGLSGYDVQQRLHYLGIPVNLVVYLWNDNPNWKIYFSGGAMAEKGIRAVYRQERNQPDLTRTTTVRSSSIEGVQWSFNGAIGVNYQFYKGLGIYFEPRVSYYFDNDQPFSARTEWPVTIGVNLGMNYKF